MTIEPTDQDIAEALREHGYAIWNNPAFPDVIRDRAATVGYADSKRIFSYARTLAKLRVAMEALDYYADDHEWMGADSADFGHVARRTVAQIRERE